jgi:hypothetical protein
VIDVLKSAAWVSKGAGSMTVWKIVAASDQRGLYFSAYQSASNGYIYEKGRTTKRREGWGPMAAFKTRHDARYYRSTVCPAPTIIFKAEGVISKDNGLWKIMASGNQVNLDSTNIPAGTVFCDYITLLKKD